MMRTTTTFSRWTSMLALAAACCGAGAQTVGDKLVWIDNDTFGFDACAMSAAPTDVDVDAAITMLRARAESDIDGALQAAGLALDAQQFMTLTPLNGALACGGATSRVTFRVAAVDRHSGKFWKTDMTVRGEGTASDRDSVARLSGDLARHFGGLQTRAASL